jgi:hypothetical protein
MRALQRDPSQRFENAADMADVLERNARSLHCLASTREVAKYVDSVIGQEISQQRDAVRAWLAGSEPSRNDRVAVPAGPRAPADVDSHPFLLQPAPPQGSESSVSSAVIHVPEPPRPSATALLARSNEPTLTAPVLRERRSAWLWVAPVVFVGGVAGFALAYWRAAPRSVPVTSNAARAPSARPAEPVPSATSRPDAGAVAPSASPPPPSALPSAKASAVPPVKPPTSRPARSKSPQPGPADDPDDIARNPYR